MRSLSPTSGTLLSRARIFLFSPEHQDWPQASRRHFASVVFSLRMKMRVNFHMSLVFPPLSLEVAPKRLSNKSPAGKKRGGPCFILILFQLIRILTWLLKLQSGLAPEWMTVRS